MDVAIIGMAVRFPHAGTLEEFAENLANGIDLVQEISPKRRKATGLLATGAYKLLGHLEDIDLFEGAFFGISKAEALTMSPHQRIMMEMAYEAFENAGYNFEDFNGSRTSVYMGDTHIEYYEYAKVIEPTLFTGNMNSIIASRISRFFNLRGKALMIDTTCSSSLVALHLACQDLASGYSDYALVGGINLLLFPPKKYTDDHLGIISADGKARAFSAQANGTGTGEGGVCLLLKPLEKARSDRDIIHAIIKGSAANQDAGLSGSLTAPSSTAQAEVITEAWMNAGIDPSAVTYIEAHGTGTKLGDPIEVEGIDLAFKRFTGKKKFCAISSIKTNIGHTDTVAGLAGFVKAVLSLKRQQLFPSLHFTEPNPFIDFDNSAVFVNDKLRSWPRNGLPRTAGVSSFGMTGTNCHVILQESMYPPAEGPAGKENEAYLICISAKTEASLKKNKLALLQRIKEDKSLRLEDISYTLLMGRKQYDYRYAVVISSLSELEMALEIAEESSSSPEDQGKAVFILSDWQNPAMDVIGLFGQNDCFRENFDACESLLNNGKKTGSFYQFAFQYSIYKFFEHIGIKIGTVTGDALGKKVIAAATSQIPLEQAVKEALEHVPAPHPDFDTRCRALLDRFMPGRVSFIELGPLGGITGQLESWLPERTGTNASPYKVIAVPQDASLFHSDREKFIAFIKLLYLEHFNIDFHKLFPLPFGHRSELPGYQFERERYWLEQELSFEKIKDWCYELQWTEEEPERDPGPLTAQPILLVSYPGDELAAVLHKKLTELGNTCYELKLNAGCETDYDNVSADLHEANKIEKVIFLAGGGQEATTHPWQEVPDPGVYAHFHLCRAFSHLLPVKGMSWITVTCQAQQVIPGEQIRPSQSMHAGLLKALQVDHLSLSVLGIDLDRHDRQAADTIVKEIRQGNTISYCAYRNGKRHVQKLMRIDMQPEHNLEELFPAQGVYLVTGGATGVGLEICKSIAQRQPATFLIIGRTTLPYKKYWDKIISEGADDSIIQRIKGLKELEREGSRVEYYSADISDEKSVRAAFEDIKRRFEKVNGVIHSAGERMESIPITDMDEQMFGKLLAPKVKGTILLDEQVQDLDPSFFVMFSSLNAWVPKKHSAAYTMANMFEDAYSFRRSIGSKIRYLSINWPGWNLNPLNAGKRAEDSPAKENNEPVRMTTGLKPITVKDGASAFFYALQGRRACIGIGDVDLSGFRNNPFFLIDQGAAIDPEGAPDLALPVIQTETAAASGQPGEGRQLTVMEYKILGIWKDVLKSDAISVEDDFFEVGGHSLLGIQVVNRIEKDLGIAVEFEVFFDYFTVRTLAAYIEGLLPHESAAKSDTLSAIEEQEYYDVSYGQRRLWVVDQLSGESVYNVFAAYILNGNFNKEALEASYAMLIGRHESLRTVLLISGEVPKQRILDPGLLDFRVKYSDLRENPDRYETADRLIRETETIRFNLYQGPLITAQLIRLETEKHFFSFSMHHIISDAWSCGIITRELIRFYNEYCSRKTISSIPLNLQFKDYASWQGKLLPSKEFSEHRRYWLEQFTGGIPVLDLPTDFPRPLVQSFTGQSVDIVFDNELIRKIREQAGKKDVTNFMILFTVVNILLYRYVGQRQIIVGTPVTERGHYDLEEQVGFYVNNLPLKTNIDGKDTFYSLLEQVKMAIVHANKHKDYPLELLIKELNLVRDTSRFPLFDVVAHYQNTSSSSGETNMDGIEVSNYRTEIDITQFDIIFDFYESEEDIVLKLIFNSSLYTSRFITEMGRHFGRLLQSALHFQSQEISSLEMLAPEERVRLLVEFNDTKADYPEYNTVIEIFEEQAAADPERDAILFEGRGVSFGELNRRANQLANYLAMKKIPAGQKIGLFAARGPEMIIAILGILKAGCTYVPLNIEYPAIRLQYIIRDAGIKHILYTDKGAEGLKRLGESGEIMHLEECLSSGMDHFRSIQVPDACAYVMYTSGTTGNPKGIAVSHRNIIKLVYDRGEIAIKPGDRVLQWSNYSFDGSVYEIFGSLLSGATLCLFRDEFASDVYELSRVMERCRITVCFLTTALFNAFVDLRPDALKGLRKILFGGEMVSRKHVGKALSITGKGKIIHVYGPTETTVFATAWPIDNWREDGVIPIGKPLSGTTVFVLDIEGQPVPAGIPGELYIGGDGVSLGYLNNEKLNREKFLPDRFSGQPGGRLYRTGDTGRWLSDGNIGFIGRTDDQVKIRGNRIEPAEIEIALMSYPDIREAAVLVRDRGEGEKVLVAYVTALTELSIPQLHLFLEKTLPSFMVPSGIFQIEKMPLSSNGKTDRRLLPETELEIAEPGKNIIRPRDETEKMILAIWEKTLGLKIPGVEDNFFAIGGHSLNALKVISEIHKQLNVRFGLKDVFTNPTVSAMAEQVKNLKKSAYISIPVVEEQEHYAVTGSQRGLWVQHQQNGAMPAYNIPAAYVFEGDLRKDLLEKAFVLLIQRHEILRTTFVEVAGEPRQCVALPEFYKFSFYYTDLEGTVSQHELVNKIADEEALRPFNLEQLPLLSAHLIRSGDSKHYFFFTINHIIADGWSMELIIHELVTLYNLLRREGAASLRPLPIQYKDYAAYQQRFTTTADLPAEKYWRRKLEGGTTPLQLPFDFPRPSRKTFNSDAVNVSFDSPLEADIRNFCQANDLSLFAFFAASVHILLYLYTGQHDIATGMPDSGRHHGDLDGQIGLYLNMLVLRSELKDEDSLLELCRKTKKDILETLEYHEYPFDLLVQRLGYKRDMARNPFFDVEVAFTNFNRVISDKASVLDEIKVSLQDTEIKAGGKFDLDFLFSESDDLGLLLFFNTDLFRKDTITAMAAHLQTIMRKMILAPTTSLKELNLPVKATVRESPRSRLKGIQSINPRPYSEEQDLVKVSAIPGSPVTMAPSIPGVNLNEWVKTHRDEVEKLLQLHGGLLFRGFSTHTVDSFELFLQSLSGSIMEYVHRSSPRHSVQNNIYTSTDHPRDQVINMHNEHSYSHQWPMKITFYCHKASTSGGETPIADSRKVLSGLKEATVRKFLDRQVMYVRKTSTGLGMTWQDIFQTTDKKAVEECCRQYKMDFTWADNDSLRMTFIRPAVRYHPRTNEPVWFNHAFFFNPLSLNKSIREVLLDQNNEALLPFRTYYGDGTEIEEEVIEEIKEVYERTRITFPWQEGDILLLDNMLMAHGRNPFQGERKILVGMSEPRGI